MTVTHSKSLTTRRKRQKRQKDLARIAKEAERAKKQGTSAGGAKPSRKGKEAG